MPSKQLSPITVQEARTMKVSQDDWISIGNRLGHPETSREAVMELAKRDGLSYKVRTKIAESPKTDEDILDVLSRDTSHGWEWRAIGQKYRSLYAEFLKNVDEKAPFSRQMTAQILETPNQAAAYVLATGGMFAEDLWHDLALKNVIELGYQGDSLEGSRFGPLWDSKIAIVNTPAERFLSPGYFCTWIEREPDADVDYVLNMLAEDGYWEEYSADSDFPSSEELIDDNFAMLVGIAYGFANGHLEVADSEKLHALVTEWAADYDEDLVDQIVKITGEPEIVGSRFEDLSESDVGFVIENLLLAEKHFMMKNFGLTNHLLSLVLLHDKTTKNQRERILFGVENAASFSKVIEYLDERG